MSKFNAGDKVKIVGEVTSYEGLVGTVVSDNMFGGYNVELPKGSVSAENKLIVAQILGDSPETIADTVAFFDHELELV